MKKIYFFLLLLGSAFIQQASAQVLLTEGFEGTFPPAGWTRINAGTGNTWKSTTDASLTDGPYATHAGNGAMVYEYNTTNAANAWMITPGVSLTAGTQYSISFFYRVRSATYPEKLKVTVGTSATVAGQTTVLWDNNGGTNLTNTGYTPAVITYTPSSSGTYYFGFNAYSDANMWALLVDDVRIEVTPATTPSCTTNTSPANNATNVSYIPYINLAWNAASGATSYDVYIGTTTTPTYLLNTGTNSVSLTGASPNTTYYWYVIPRNAKGIPSGCNASMTSFTTGPVPPLPSNDDCAGAITLSAYGGAKNATSISGTTSAGTTSCGAAATYGTPDDDVWFKFTAVQNGNATITVVGGPTFDAVVQAYSGSCGALTAIGSCTDATGDAGTETMNLTSLVGGQTYYIRVYDWSSGAGDNFTIAASGTALPVTSLDFSGFIDGKNNILTWKTATESNNKGFSIERSADGKNYSSIAFVSTKAEGGNSAAVLSYSFTDEKKLAGTNYYRLKQLDKDGQFSYSNVVELRTKISSLSLNSLYPNPATDRLNFMIASPVTDKVTLVITDISGKTILRQSLQVGAGDNSQQLDVRSLAPGTYLVKLVCANGCETAIQRFVKH